MLAARGPLRSLSTTWAAHVLSWFSWLEHVWDGGKRGQSRPGWLAHGLQDCTIRESSSCLRALFWDSCRCPHSGFLAETLLLSLRAARVHWEGKPGQAAQGEGEDPVTRHGMLSLHPSSGKRPSFMTKPLRKTHGPNVCDAFKRAQHQPTGVPTPYACLRLLRPERGSAPSRWGCVCVRESVWRAQGGEREATVQQNCSSAGWGMFRAQAFVFPFLYWPGLNLSHDVGLASVAFHHPSGWSSAEPCGAYSTERWVLCEDHLFFPTQEQPGPPQWPRGEALLSQHLIFWGSSTSAAKATASLSWGGNVEWRRYALQAGGGAWD